MLAVTPYRPLPQPPASSNLLSVCMDLPVLDAPYRRTHTMQALCDWLLSLGIMSWRFIHVLASVPRACLWLSNIPSWGWTAFGSPIHQLMDIWVASTCGLLWAVLLWTFVYKFLYKDVFISLQSLLKSVAAESHGVSMFNLWETDRLVIFPRSCIILHFPVMYEASSFPSYYVEELL